MFRMFRFTRNLRIPQARSFSNKYKPVSLKEKWINRPPGEAIPISWKTLTVAISLSVGGIYYLNQERQKIKQKDIKKASLNYGKPDIGGDFELIDVESEKKVSSKELGFMIIYFGFTHCPDVCPDELEKMAVAIERLDALKIPITPVFITVDPERDNCEVVRKYIREFHPRFRGFTGSLEEISQVAKKFRIYISKSDGDDYLVDHSIFFFLMAPDGFKDFYGRNSTPDEIVSSVARYVKEYEQKSGK